MMHQPDSTEISVGTTRPCGSATSSTFLPDTLLLVRNADDHDPGGARGRQVQRPQ